MLTKLNWLPSWSARTNKSMAAVSPNSLSVRSLAGKLGPGCCWLSHTSHRSWSAARTATALPPVIRMALASAWFEGCPKFVCIWRRFAINLRSSSVVRSGSGWSLGRIRTLVAGNVSCGVRLMASLTVDVIRLSATKWGFTCWDYSNKALLRPASSWKFVPFLIRRHIFWSSSTVFTSADTQSYSTREEEALEQLFLSSTLKTHLVQRVLWEQSWQTGWEHRSERTEQTKQWRGCSSWCGNWATFFRHDLEDFCTLAAERQRELIKIVAIDWSSFSVRGSCLFFLARRRTGICQSCGFNRSARCPALLTTNSSTPVPIVSVFSPISTGRSQEISTNQQGQVFRRNHAENNSALLASNKNLSCYSDRRDECTTVTKFVPLSFTSFINLVFQTKSSSKLL